MIRPKIDNLSRGQTGSLVLAHKDERIYTESVQGNSENVREVAMAKKVTKLSSSYYYYNATKAQVKLCNQSMILLQRIIF